MPIRVAILVLSLASLRARVAAARCVRLEPRSAGARALFCTCINTAAVYDNHRGARRRRRDYRRLPRSSYEDKAEVEKAFDITISTDPEIWESNDFMQYVGEREWKQKSIERVVLLVAYVLLNSVAKLSVRMDAKTFDEYVDLPWGRQEQNKWVVYGYVNERVRVVRSRDGKSLGQWFLQKLEPDSSATLLKYEMMPENGGFMTASFER